MSGKKRVVEDASMVLVAARRNKLSFETQLDTVYLALEFGPDPSGEDFTELWGPSVQAAALSMELYLKYLALRHLGTFQATHDLHLLWTDLPDPVQAQISELAQPAQTMDPYGIEPDSFFQLHRNLFVDWRYFWEKFPSAVPEDIRAGVMLLEDHVVQSGYERP